MAKTSKKAAVTLSKKSKRANKYEEKLQINGSFEDVMKALVTPKQPVKKK
jgi:hypothetical protein